MKPTQNWMNQWSAVKKILIPDINLNTYFEEDIIGGQQLDVMDIGEVYFPTGELLVRDPLCYLTKEEDPYLQTIPVGKYPLKVCVVMGEEDDCDRYAAVKLEVTAQLPVRFEEALMGNEDLAGVEAGQFFGFNVDAGLGTIVDVQTRDAYDDFCEKWYAQNVDKNIYDDFFAKEFAKSYKRSPDYQRTEGDWINFQIPGTELTIPMFQSGFGDGAYPVYFGYDQNDQVCCVIIQFIDIETAYSEEE